MKKSVRFSELSFIQETEEDHGEIILAVPKLTAKSVSPTGAPVLASLPSQPAGGVIVVEASLKPASCPFGDRIVAKKEQGDAQNEAVPSPPPSSSSSSKDDKDSDLKFPRNIILLQEQEKAKAAKKKRTAGINPSAGKERGTSFIIARNYLYNVTDNSDKFLPRGLSSQAVTFPVAANAEDSVAEKQAASPAVGSPRDDTFISDDIKDASIEAVIDSRAGISPPPPCNQNPINDIESTNAPPLYSPNQALASAVNPFLAPSNQYHGSVAYGLKSLPNETLSKPNVVVSSKVNQYLHYTPEYHRSPSSNDQEACHREISSSQNPNHSQENPAVSSDCVVLTDLGNPDTPSLQFLRDHFGTPVPISSNTLYHVDPATRSPYTNTATNASPHPNNDTYRRGEDLEASSEPHQIKDQSSHAPTESIPVIGPIVLSPRKQAIQPRSPSPTPGSRQEPLITTNPSPSANAPALSAPSTTFSVSAPVPTITAANTAAMSGIGGAHEIYRGVVPLARAQEKQELLRLNERFSNYVSTVRQLGQQLNNVDTTAFHRSTKILEDEIVTLKAMYEKELDGLRNEIEYNFQERNSLHSQVNSYQKSTGELQDRLAIETDKNSRLLDEINVLQRKIGNLESDVRDATVSCQRPQEEVEHLQRTIDNLTREAEQWKHRYEHENLARQEVEDKFQQIRKKVEFSDQIHTQQVVDFQSRLDTSSATILSLEAKVRELSTADVTVAEMLKQVRDTAETELRKYQIESEEQYSRNLTALKAQIDHDADALQRGQTEKSELMGSIGELHAKIRNLEGQVANLQHQKCTLEDAVAVERNRAADNIRHLEVKLREVQDLLVVKMREVTNAREASIPLKAEIEMLKALMEEEERRLRIPLGIVPASVVQTSIPQCPTTSQILNSSISNQILKPTSPPNPLSAASAVPTAIGIPGYQQAGNAVICRPPSTGIVNSAAISSQSTSQAVATSQMLPPLTRVTNPTSVTFSATSHAAPVQRPSSAVAAAAAAEACKSTTIPAAETSSSLTTNMINANYNYPPPGIMSCSGLSNPLYPYVPSPPLDTQYIPEALHTVDDEAIHAYDMDYGSRANDYELYMQGISFPMSGPRYLYEATPSVNRLHVEPSPPISPRQPGCSIPARAKSAPVAKDRDACQTENAKQSNINFVSTNLGNGRDYFDEMFKDLQKETLFAKPRPKSSPCERPLPSTFHDYTVSTSSAIGDLKILEVNQDGKFVRLHNDGQTEVEFGGYMIQQNVGGHPVAVFRFPPRTKFAPDSTITVWAAMNDPLLHNPPTDFFWKEQQKWGTGPECTSILCRANGQAIAWTTAAHRFTKDAFQETATDADDGRYSYSKKDGNDAVDDESLTELNIDATGPKPEPVYLRREKQQPPSLVAPKHPHGSSPCTSIHPHTGQQRPLRYGNDNSSVNRQSRTQSTRPDPIPGQPYAGAPAQRLGSAPLRKMGNNGSQPNTMRNNGTLANKSSLEIGETSESPSAFMTPHSRFKSGLEQVKSQHHPDFLPPMPRPPHTSW